MSIEWTGFAEGDKNEYVPSSGSYDPQTNSQTGTLTVQSPAVNSDKTYTCTASSIQNTESDSNNFDVHLNVYGSYLFCNSISLSIWRTDVQLKLVVTVLKNGFPTFETYVFLLAQFIQI